MNLTQFQKKVNMYNKQTSLNIPINVWNIYQYSYHQESTIHVGK